MMVVGRICVAPLAMSLMLGFSSLISQGADPGSCEGEVCSASGEPGLSALLQVNKPAVEKLVVKAVTPKKYSKADLLRLTLLTVQKGNDTSLAAANSKTQHLGFMAQTPDLTASGAASSLDEAGYQSVASMCCPMEAYAFGARVVFQLGFEICNTGDLAGVMAWFYCDKQERTYDELVTALLKNSKPFWGQTYGVNCAFLAYPGQCVEKDEDCPSWLGVDNPNAPIIGTRGTCCYPSAATAFVFSGAEVTSNNLGGNGPNTGDAPELRYSGAGEKNGRKFDLVVTADSYYKGGTGNGINGLFGQIGLFAGRSVDLTFSLEDSASGDPVVLDEFYFSFLDLDEEITRIRERVFVRYHDATGPVDRVLYPINDLTEVELPDGRTRYESTVTAGPWNNPTDPNNLGVVQNPNQNMGPLYPKSSDQRKEALMFIYRQTSSWKLTIEVTHTEGEPHGRNFLFGGTSALMDICPRKTEPETVTTDAATTPPPVAVE